MTVAIDVQPGHGLFIAGQNGTGKSVLASEIASRWDRVLVLDPKMDPESLLPNAAVCYGVKAAKAALPGRVIYRPLPTENARLSEFFGQLIRKIMEAGGAHGIVVHELGDLGASDRELETFTSNLLRTRRSRRIPLVLVTQRPFNVPRLALSEAQHVIAFHLTDPRDRARMAEVMGPEVAADPIPRDYSFWYRGPDLALHRIAPLPYRGA